MTVGVPGGRHIEPDRFESLLDHAVEQEGSRGDEDVRRVSVNSRRVRGARRFRRLTTRDPKSLVSRVNRRMPVRIVMVYRSTTTWTPS